MNYKATLLIVDDTPANISVLLTTLKESGFKTLISTGGRDAIEKVEYANPDLILLDVMMPDMDGFETCKILKSKENTKDIPIIFMTALTYTGNKIEAFRLGAADYIAKPLQHEEVLARINTHLSLRTLQLQVKNQNISLEQQVKQRTYELERTRLQLISSLGRAAEFRDNETGLHVIRMSKSSEFLARAAKLSDPECNLLRNTSPMHDIGKIGIPDHILLKPSRLNAEEWEVMKTHTTIGEEILSGNDSQLLKTAAILARSHHERWDGSGYPDGLKGEEIPIFSRITAICDVFDALLSKRPYKQAWTTEETLSYMKEQRKKFFDPYLIDVFFDCLEDMLAIYEHYADD
jgi:putative two-component system response regulator